LITNASDLPIQTGSLSTDVSEVRAASIIRNMVAERTSETSVDNYFTRQYIPEDNSEPIKQNFKCLCLQAVSSVIVKNSKTISQGLLAGIFMSDFRKQTLSDIGTDDGFHKERY
jgi:hypothetical protein